MDIQIIEESGYENALRGIGMSYGKENIYMCELHKIALKLAPKNGGHNKFLESINVALRINAPLYFWKQFDTYTIGMTKQFDTTMHTIMKSELKKEHFEGEYEGVTIDTLLDLSWQRTQYCRTGADKSLHFNIMIKRLPSSFLQARRISTNYKVIGHIISQRRNHKIAEWTQFCDSMKDLEHFCFLESLYK